MEKLNKLAKLLEQFPNGIRIIDLTRKLGVRSRSTVYDYLNSLERMGKAHYERGIAYLGRGKSYRNVSPEESELLKERIRADARIRSAEVHAISNGERQ